MGTIPTIALPIAAVVLAIVLVLMLFVKNYIKVPPNVVAVFTGGGRQKIVRGGAKFRIPVLERVDFMSLEPFSIEVSVTDVYSQNGVPVSVTAVGLVRFGSDDQMIATAVQRFLTTDRSTLHAQVKEILAGNMRSIVSQMTVEDLNNKRDEFTKKVLSEAADVFKPIGMEIDVLTIQSISDANGYLAALGRTRTAEVKRDAEIGEAEAKRDSTIRTAEAERAGKEAEAAAATQIAQAERNRDIELAKIKALVDKEKATADQAGPLAEAEARRAVVVAQAETDMRAEEAQIAVEQQRTERARSAAEADVIVPAQAASEATVVKANADAQAVRLAAEAEAEARKQQAAAHQTELEAAAAGKEADLKAQATGQKELATALGEFTPDAIRVLIGQMMIEKMPEMAAHFAEQIGAIDKMVVVQNGGSDGDNSSMMQQLVSAVPAGIVAIKEAMSAMSGTDIQELLGGRLTGANGTNKVAEAVNGLLSSESVTDTRSDI